MSPRRTTNVTRCQVPGCATKGTPVTQPVTITVSGHPVPAERLCSAHRALLAPSRAQRARQAHRNAENGTQTLYACSCGVHHGTYRAAERCADSHHGARIAIVTGPPR
jgi:hypothetical protein